VSPAAALIDSTFPETLARNHRQWPVTGDSMSDNYIVEIEPPASAGSARDKVQAGIVVREHAGFRFFAASRAFFDLEQRLFKSPQAAAEAALRQLSFSQLDSHHQGSAS
jgi:hypothetical protein